jgi:hypothetical protein
MPPVYGAMDWRLVKSALSSTVRKEAVILVLLFRGVSPNPSHSTQRQTSKR